MITALRQRLRVESRSEAAAWIVAAADALMATGFLFGVWPEDVGWIVSDLALPTAAIASGLIITYGARRRSHDAALAWTLTGVGILAWGLGEAAWGWYELVFQMEVPYPGPPDLFYLSGYLLVAPALVLMPHRRQGGYRAFGLSLDALMGAISLTLLSWHLLLEPLSEAATDMTSTGLVVTIGYPVGDILLLIAAVFLSTRHNRNGRPLVFVALGITAFLITDFAYLIQEWFTGYETGTTTDAGWMLAYGLFAAAGGLLLRTNPDERHRNTSTPGWQLVFPYLLIGMLGVVFITGVVWQFPRPVTPALSVGLVFVVCMSVARQWVSLAERRQIVERERRELVSVVSHELRTPLTAVSGFLDIVIDEWDTLTDLERRSMIQTAGTESHHLNRIVTDLIQLSRGRLHEENLRVSTISIEHAVRRATAMTSDMGAVVIDVEAGLMAMADPGRLSQILVNLLTNAGRYGEGEIRIVGRTVRNTCVLEVHDNGPGVPRRYEHAIWEHFERGAHRLDGRVPGSGIGLAVVRALAIAHGGAAGYRQSPLLGGACFWVSLPLPQPAPPLMPTSEARPTASRRASLRTPGE